MGVEKQSLVATHELKFDLGKESWRYAFFCGVLFQFSIPSSSYLHCTPLSSTIRMHLLDFAAYQLFSRNQGGSI
jgi:hypothetical protein